MDASKGVSEWYQLGDDYVTSADDGTYGAFGVYGALDRQPEGGD
jgi:hypothetical protein